MTSDIYGGKAIIALYNAKDECVFVAETWRELAEYLGYTVQNAMVRMWHVKRGINGTGFLIDGCRLTPHIIPIEKEKR